MNCVTCNNPLLEGAAYCPACGARQPWAPDPSLQPAPTYSAFISYRHTPLDMRVAREVQRFLETYRLPEQVARSSAAPLRGRKLLPAFRDQDELAASPSLPDSIQRALASSSALVVVCSPNTAGSEWVSREIELFASLHGRDRIFTVLVGGASDQVIPQMLQTRAVPATRKTAHAGPLAVDLRAEKGRAFRYAEKLRLTAGIVGCSYDDLAQRDRRRRVAWAGALGAAALCLALVVSGLVGHFAQDASENREQALISESLQLAEVSRQQLEDGDRYAAIETALSALPSSSTDTSRPLVPEAQQALADALQVYPESRDFWRASYTVTTDAPMLSLRVSEQGGWFAVLDANRGVTTYNSSTGARLATIELPAEYAAAMTADDSWNLRDVGPYLVVASSAGDGVVACYDPFTGELLWHEAVYVDAIAGYANDEFAVTQFALALPDQMMAATLDTGTGELVAINEFNVDTNYDTFTQAYSVMGTDAWSYFVSLDDRIYHMDLETGEVQTAQAAYPKVTTLDYHWDTLVVSSMGAPDDVDASTAPYAVQAFDSELNELWRVDGVGHTEVLSMGEDTVTLSGAPHIECFFNADEPAVECNAGRDLVIYALDDGSELYRRSFDSSVIGVYRWIGQTQKDTLIVACADGTITIKDPLGQLNDTEGEATRFHTGSYVRFEQTVVSAQGYFVALTVPADSNDRIVAYRTDLTYGTEPDHEYTLDELLELADQTLSDAGLR